MKIRTRSAGLILAPLLLFLGWQSPLQASETLGMLTDLSGRVELETAAGERRPAALLDYLGAADRVEIAGSGMAVISYLKPAAEWTMQGPGSWQMGPEAPQPLQGAAPQRRGLDPMLTQPVALDLEKQRIELRTAGLVMRQLDSKIETLAPTGPKVAGNPVFRWKKLPGVELYRVRLEQSRGSILLDLPVSGDRLELPEAVSLPPDRRYRWQVESEGKGPVARSPWMQFATLPASVQQRLTALRPAPDAPFSRRVLYARALEAEGVTDEARSLWAELADQRPDLAGVLQSRSTQ
jgi:hypothetical protein